MRSAVSDQQGAVVFEGAEPNGTLVLARKNRQLALVSLQRPALDLSEFGLPARPQRPLELFVYAPRDLYRPGETVVINALLRDHDGRQVTSQPVQATLSRPDGRVYRSFAWHGRGTSRVSIPPKSPCRAIVARSSPKPSVASPVCSATMAVLAYGAMIAKRPTGCRCTPPIYC